mgnify:CR=1 FL=1
MSEMIDRKIIGRRMAELRGGRTQEEVARAINVSISALSSYELGERIPRDPIKVRIANYFGVSIQSIFFDS